MNKLTEEQAKLQFFALHLGAEVEVEVTSTSSTSSYIGQVFKTNIATKQIGVIHNTALSSVIESIDNCKIILTDLKDISDEDCIEVAKLLNEYDVRDKNNIERCITLAKGFCRNGRLIDGLITLKIYDFLRSKHYNFQTEFLGYKTENWIKIK